MPKFLRLGRCIAMVMMSLALPIVAGAEETRKEDEPWLVRTSRDNAATAKAPVTESESAFTRIPHDKKIRLEVNDVRLEGPFERFAADTLWFMPRTSTVPMAVPADSIDALWTRGNAAGKGALIGAILGGATGLGLGLAVEEADESAFLSGANNGQSEPLLGLTVGALGGMVFGSLLGLPFSRWHKKHP